MRKQYLLAILLFFSLCSWGQTETAVTVDLSTQRLSEAVPNTENITSLTLTNSTANTGLTFDDAVYLHDNFANLETLDLSATRFLASTGSKDFSLDVITDASGKKTTISGKLTCTGRYLPSGLLAGKTKLKSVSLPNGKKGGGLNLYAVNAYSFAGCTALESVDLGDNANLNTVGQGAFIGCTSLKTIDLSAFTNNFNSIGNDTFNYCTSLTEVKFPTLKDGYSKTLNIGANAFKNCTSLTAISLPISVKTISNDLFDGCKKLASVSLPSGLTTIYREAFRNCNALESITLPDGLKEIQANAFNGSGLKSIVIPNSVETIGVAAFSVCPNLASITLPENDKFTTIANYSISRCGALTTISIPANVTNIGKSAFNSTSLTSITVNSAIPSKCDTTESPFTSIRNNRFKVIFAGAAVGHEDAYREVSGWDYLMSKSISEEDAGFAEQTYNRNGKMTPYEQQGITAGTGLRVYLQRTFTNGWNSLVLPFTASGDVVKKTLGENVKVAKLTSIGDNELTFTYVDDCSIDEDVPVIVSGIDIPSEQRDFLSAGAVSKRDNVYVFDGVDIKNNQNGKTNLNLTVGNVTMKGTFKGNDAVHINNGYFLQNGNLYAGKSGVNYSVKAFRAWFEVSGGNAKSMTFSVVDGSTVTGIKAVEKTEQNNGVIYDLQGRVANNPVRGIYIKSGKKFIVK